MNERPFAGEVDFKFTLNTLNADISRANRAMTFTSDRPLRRLSYADTANEDIGQGDSRRSGIDRFLKQKSKNDRGDSRNASKMVVVRDESRSVTDASCRDPDVVYRYGIANSLSVSANICVDLSDLPIYRQDFNVAMAKELLKRFTIK